MVLTDEEIVDKVSQAFAPLRCVAEIWDYDYRLKFKVFDMEGRGIIEIPEIILGITRNERELDQILDQMRLQIQNKGFVLN